MNLHAILSKFLTNIVESNNYRFYGEILPKMKQKLKFHILKLLIITHRIRKV